MLQHLDAASPFHTSMLGAVASPARVADLRMVMTSVQLVVTM